MTTCSLSIHLLVATMKTLLLGMFFGGSKYSPHFSCRFGVGSHQVCVSNSSIYWQVMSLHHGPFPSGKLDIPVTASLPTLRTLSLYFSHLLGGRQLSYVALTSFMTPEVPASLCAGQPQGHHFIPEFSDDVVISDGSTWPSDPVLEGTQRLSYDKAPASGTHSRTSTVAISLTFSSWLCLAAELARQLSDE
jgi:hypothetical protein